MVDVVVSKQKSEMFIEAIVRRWRRRFPDEAYTFERACSEYRRILDKTSGMATSGDSMILGHVPTRVKTAVARGMPGFWQEKGAQELFFKVYKKASVR